MDQQRVRTLHRKLIIQIYNEDIINKRNGSYIKKVQKEKSAFLLKKVNKKFPGPKSDKQLK